MGEVVIEEDLYGANLCQALVDRIHARAVSEGNGSGVVDIVVRNVSVMGYGFPRLMVDYGEVYSQLERTVQAVEKMTANEVRLQQERERVVRILESRRNGRGPSFNDIIDSLLREIRDEEPDEACL